ncbi:hypothetical protein Tco_0937114, partial [Tanacetum coccineum]
TRVLNISLAVRYEPERIFDHLEDPVSHAPLAFNSQGEHSEGKPALAFSTPTGISLGGSSEPLTLSPDHKPLGGCEPKERLDGMKLDQRKRKHDQSDLVSEAGREGIEAYGAKIKAASTFRSALWLLAIKSGVTFGRGENEAKDIDYLFRRMKNKIKASNSPTSVGGRNGQINTYFFSHKASFPES